MTRIVQIAPSIGPGSGVAGVAYELERELAANGATVERFTAVEAGRRQCRKPNSPVGARLAHAWDVVWFSTVGTRRARRFLAERPDAVSICHNDAMVGDIYVNHGLLEEAMRARGHYAWRMLRNPLHIFTAARDRLRYRGRTHRAIVALTTTEAALLSSIYGQIPARIEVIPNGVDLERFRPASAQERDHARRALAIDDDAFVVAFVGHEFDRKGLPIAMAAIRGVPTAILLVVGGTTEMIRRDSAQAAGLGVGTRVRFVGSDPDPIPFLRASDVFVLPSAYESYGLVITEALASGIPVVATPVGVAADVIVDGENGYLAPANPEAFEERLAQIAAADLESLRQSARQSVSEHSGQDAARRYLRLAESIPDARPPRGAEAQRLRIVHAIRSDGYSGVERFVVRLALAQASGGHRVTVVGGAPDRMDPALGSEVEFGPASTTAQLMRAVRRLRHSADVVNTHMTAADVGAAAALRFTRRSRRPAVVATRHFAKARGRIGPVPIGPLVRHRIDGQIAISHAVAEVVDGPTTVVHSGIDGRPFRDVSVRERVVLIAQRLQPEKRTEVGVRAFAASGLADHGWTLEIAGTGPERAALEALAAALGIASATRFLGYRDDLPTVMDRAGLLIAPCPVEGLGLTVLEAMAGGLPVVAAGAAGHIDLLADLDSRSMFDPDDVGDAATKVRSLAEDGPGRSALARAAHLRQQRAFSLRAQSAATEAVYRATLRGLR